LIKEALSTLLRHPDLLIYVFSNPRISTLRTKAKELRRQDRQNELMEIRHQATNKEERTFIFNGKTYEYFYHDYNDAWAGERTVEIPIIWEKVEEQNKKGGRVLEVGNVLLHYFESNHTVVDRFERWPGVINEDILSFEPTEKFDLIVSISTLEHIGWSLKRGLEDPRGFYKAIAKLFSFLKEGGEIWFTVPIGYNPYVDDTLSKGTLCRAQIFCMKRISSDNRWRDCDYSEVSGYPYGGFRVEKRRHFPYPKANAIAVVRISKKDNLPDL
jgi:SAM-dependent methyltransferase